MSLTLALDNIRSLHNVGTLMRSAYALGFTDVVTIGITPHPKVEGDRRLPHVIERAERAIHKTALGGEALFRNHFYNVEQFLDWVKDAQSYLLAVELSTSSTDIKALPKKPKTVVVLGNEVDGVSSAILSAADQHLHIPTHPRKRSLNVSAAGAIALYEIARKNGIL